MFRMTFRIPPQNRIDHGEPELVLREGPAERVVIKPLTLDATVREADSFALCGGGYRSEGEAQADGERWASALALGLVAQLVPPDFERRKPRGQFAQSVLDRVNATMSESGRLYSDRPGLVVVPEDPPPAWSRFNASGVGLHNAPAAVAATRRAYDDDLRLDDLTSLAIDLHSAAASVGDTDAQFLMLMFAVEAMIERHPREAPQLAVVNRLLEILAELPDLKDDDRSKLSSALGELRTESISAAGRRLAAGLDPRRYDGRTAVQFFTHAYGIRSKLVHGSTGEARPDVELVHALQGPLNWFVRDLILTRAGLNLPHPLDPVSQDHPTG